MTDRIVVTGAREHNLKNINVEIPRDRLVVITGLSGSGKSSLAFDTIYAEGQRRYVESLSAYARQFLEQMEKPDVDSIEGLSPAISIEQKTTSRNPRSTVGTVTEIYDYLRLLFARVGTPYCYQCGKPIAAQTIQQIVDQIMALPSQTRLHILAPIARGRKGEFRKELLRPAQGRLRARAHRRQAARAGRGHRPWPRRSSTPSRCSSTASVIREGIEKRLADSLERRLSLRRRGGQGRAARRGRREGPTGDALQPEVRLRRLRHLLSRADAAHVLVQQPARRLPDLQRARHQHVLRSRARSCPTRICSLGEGRDRAVGAQERRLCPRRRAGRLGAPLQDRPRNRLQEAARGGAEGAALRHGRTRRLPFYR